jgi:hypothetical protein
MLVGFFLSAFSFFLVWTFVDLEIDKNHVGTAALGCPAECSSAPSADDSTSRDAA